MLQAWTNFTNDFSLATEISQKLHSASFNFFSTDHYKIWHQPWQHSYHDIDKLFLILIVREKSFVIQAPWSTILIHCAQIHRYVTVYVQNGAVEYKVITTEMYRLPCNCFSEDWGKTWVGALSMADKILANERRRYLCNVFSHWLRPC